VSGGFDSVSLEDVSRHFGRRRALSRFLQQFCTDRTELLYRGALEHADQP